MDLKQSRPVRLSNDETSIWCEEALMSESFTISCADCGVDVHIHQDWNRPPRTYQACKAFRTELGTDLFGNTAHRTCNSIGQLLGESHDEIGVFGDKRRGHASRTGRRVGTT